MRRREFITLLGGAAAFVSGMAFAQQRERMRRVAVLMNSGPNDPDGQARLAAFMQGMQETGWSVGRNLNINLRWGAGDADNYRNHATELVKLSPDVIVTSGGTTTRAVQQASRTVPTYSSRRPIRSGVEWSRTWRGRAATPPDSVRANSASARNG